MPTEAHPPASSAADDLAAAIDSAAFVRIVAAPTGDAVAAAGLLGRACRERSVGFQVSVAPCERDTEADLRVAIGCRGGDRAIGLDRPASPIAGRLGRADQNDPALAAVGERLSGAGGSDPVPGVAGPTGDPVDDLAHSTLLRGPFSGDRAAVEALCDRLSIDPASADAAAHRRLAGAAAVRTVAAPEAPPAAGRAISAAIGRTEAGPFASVGGLADVLDVLADTRPGEATTLALGGAVPDAIAHWRAAASRAHEALDDATTGRYDGLGVFRLAADAPVGTVARLAVAYVTPEPLALAIAGDRLALASRTDDADARARLAGATDALGGTAVGNRMRAVGRIDADAADVIGAVREVAA